MGTAAGTAASIALTALTLSAQAPQEPPVFRDTVAYIEVDALVTDKQGAFVRGLTMADFELLEDGQPQTITDFRFVDLPLEPQRKQKDPVRESDVVGNTGEHRSYVLLLEPMLRPNAVADIRRAQNVAHQFVDEALGPNDLAAVIHPQGSMSHAQAFTSHKSLLHASIDYLPRSVILSQAPDICDLFRVRNTYQAIEEVSARLGAVSSRRKAIIWIGGRIPFDLEDVCAPALVGNIASMHRDALRAATRNNVAIYSVDPLGLLPDSGSPGSNVLTLSDAGALRGVAEDTGGRAMIGTNRFSEAFQQVVRDNSTYYLFGYYPTRDWRDGRFHPITVRVKRPGLTVRVRRGYYAPGAETRRPATLSVVEGLPPPAAQALRSPLPTNGLALEVLAVPFQGTDGRGSVLLGARLRVADLARTGEDRLEFAHLTIDTRGAVTPGRRNIITLNDLKETRAVGSGEWFRYFDRLDLAPGRHEVRLVAHQPGGSTGSVITHVEVPDFSKEPLTMSGIVVTSANAADRILRGDPLVTGLLSAEPTLQRRFARTDTLTAFAEVYPEARTRPDEVRLTATLTMASKSRVREDPGTLVPGTERRSGYTVRLPLSDLAAGEYVWTWQARAGRRTASRQIVFWVE